MTASCLSSFVNCDTCSPSHMLFIINSVQKLTQVIKPHSTGFLRTQRHNKKY